MSGQPMRGEGGRFLKGHKSISPGRPKRTEEAEYTNATVSACTPEQWQRIVAAAVKDCDSPKVSERSAARHFLLKALFGSTPGALVQIANIQTNPAESVRIQPGELRRAVAEVYGVELPETGAETVVSLQADAGPVGKGGLSAVTVDALRRAILGVAEPVSQLQAESTTEE